LIGTERNGFGGHYEFAPSTKRGVREFRETADLVFGPSAVGTPSLSFLIIYRA
jgi:hypothetical protein